MSEFHHKKQFLNLPKYPGGSKAFREFIAANLKYPDAARDARVEGTVIVGYDIHDNGDVHNAHILKGLGYGCDEEAIRVVSLLKFEKVKNRGLRVKMTTKTNINFRPQEMNINYTVTYTSTPAEYKKPGTDPKKSEPEVYGYTVDL